MLVRFDADRIGVDLAHDIGSQVDGRLEPRVTGVEEVGGLRKAGAKLKTIPAGDIRGGGEKSLARKQAKEEKTREDANQEYVTLNCLTRLSRAPIFSISFLRSSLSIDSFSTSIWSWIIVC